MSVEGADQVIANLEKWVKERQALAELAVNEVMAALEGWAKSEHSYTDRTANTTNSIRGEVVEASATIVRGVLSAGMEYDVFLELARDGKWAFLWPTIIRHEQDILNILRNRLGASSVGASLSRSGSLARQYSDFHANRRNTAARRQAMGADEMSTATKQAISAAMRADAQLVALLAKRPDDATRPAIFNARFSQIKPVYNCITYRIADGAPDHRFRPAINAGGGQSRVEDEYLEIEAWSQKTDSADLENILTRLNALFDGQPLSLTTGRIFRAECVMTQTDLYDKTLNASFLLARYRLRIAKG